MRWERRHPSEQSRWDGPEKAGVGDASQVGECPPHRGGFMVASPAPLRNAKAAPDEREARPIRRRMRGRGIADPDPSSRAGILLDPPGYLNGC
jgi:hypothetical protein